MTLSMVPDSPTSTFHISEELIQACADACMVNRTIVDKVVPASSNQEHRMNHHLETGSYMTQMVLQYDGKPNKDFIINTLNVMRAKNHILRTRLIKHRGQTLQVVLKDSLHWQEKVGLLAYKKHNLNARMDFGTPLCRYAFVQESHETFFVWTVHHSVIDAWTLRLMFDDLQAGSSDLVNSSQAAQRMPYGRYIRWLQSHDYNKAYHFWRSHYNPFDNVQQSFPIFGRVGFSTVSTSRYERLLHLPKAGDTNFTLTVIGHAAWALSIVSSSSIDDLTFITLNPARKANSNEFEHVMGPISVPTPLRVQFSNDLTVEELMRAIKAQLWDMVGFEHHAMTALRKEGPPNRPDVAQAVFSWNPPGSDIYTRRVLCRGSGAVPASLEYRPDLSTPATHDYGMLLDVYEHDDYVSIHTSWDSDLIDKKSVIKRVNEFGDFLISIARRQDVLGVDRMVDDMLAAQKERVRQATQQKPPQAAPIRTKHVQVRPKPSKPRVQSMNPSGVNQHKLLQKLAESARPGR